MTYSQGHDGWFAAEGCTSSSSRSDSRELWPRVRVLACPLSHGFLLFAHIPSSIQLASSAARIFWSLLRFQLCLLPLSSHSASIQLPLQFSASPIKSHESQKPGRQGFARQLGLQTSDCSVTCLREIPWCHNVPYARRKPLQNPHPSRYILCAGHSLAAAIWGHFPAKLAVLHLFVIGNGLILYTVPGRKKGG